MITITKREIRSLLARERPAEEGFTDADLARWFGVSQSAVSQWGEDDPLPDKRVLFVLRQRPDLFSIGQAASNDASDPKQAVANG